jgi:Polyketide cyclase / dehydrase and lipid transport
MPQVTAQTWVPLSPERAFAVSQTTGDVRLRWDPFIRSQRFADGATAPAKGVRTLTHARVGPRMVSEYVSYRPPTSVGMTMVKGPWFFETFGGGWRFVPEDGGTRAVWKYTYAVRPRWLRFVAEPAGQWLLGREIHRRIEAFARGCQDPVVLAAADEALRAGGQSGGHEGGR